MDIKKQYLHKSMCNAINYLFTNSQTLINATCTTSFSSSSQLFCATQPPPHAENKLNSYHIIAIIYFKKKMKNAELQVVLMKNLKADNAIPPPLVRRCTTTKIVFFIFKHFSPHTRGKLFSAPTVFPQIFPLLVC